MDVPFTNTVACAYLAGGNNWRVYERHQYISD